MIKWGLFFNIIPLAIQTLLPSVLQCLDFIGKKKKKKHLQQIWHHHINFSFHPHILANDFFFFFFFFFVPKFYCEHKTSMWIIFSSNISFIWHPVKEIIYLGYFYSQVPYYSYYSYQAAGKLPFTFPSDVLPPQTHLPISCYKVPLDLLILWLMHPQNLARGKSIMLSETVLYLPSIHC